ncbi:PadR family transcriptional regulator [Candidatus Pacearchaeota archaeon]|nr:PadR family transcriptional regulator [Candidatus Pacearchaeota archaeon]
MRGMLSFLILFLLSKKEMSGKELSDEIGERKGARPSPGTIYPALKVLNLQGLIKEKKEGKEIFYSLSAEGERSLEVAKERFCKVFMDVL